MTLFVITVCHWPICRMICFIAFVRLLFPYWLLWRVIPYIQFQLRVHGGCDRSAEDAYSSVASDHTFTIAGGLLCTTLEFLFAFWIMITFDILLTSIFGMWTLYSTITNIPRILWFSWLIDWFFTVLRPSQEYFSYMETSPLPVKGCKI
jgi:type IV secretory pathway TrbD component